MKQETTAIDGTATKQDIKMESAKRFDTLITECKIFFAFSNEQFATNKTELKEGEKYVSIGAGGYMPKGYVQQWNEGTKAIKTWEKAQRKAQKDSEKEKHILYELNNHEAFYTGSIDDAMQVLSDHYTREQVQTVFNNNLQFAE